MQTLVCPPEAAFIYNEQVKLTAFERYLLGETPEQIATHVRSQTGGKTSPLTIKKWSQTPDEQGKTWQTRREYIQTALRESAEQRSQSILEHHQTRAETIYEALYERLVGENSPEVKTYEGAVYAFKALSEFIIKTQQSKEQPGALYIVQTLLETLQEHPEINRAIRKHWPALQKKFRERLIENE